MTKWEYKIISVEIEKGKIEEEIKGYERIEQVLNKAGEEGWELVFVAPRFGNIGWDGKRVANLFLKRKIQ
ncbi:MAG: hypothetical protein DRH33_01135 [Candidatus Nealsonbacteria bacterium]|nr:MAG: hypothetical protein DRH33_01135 [Candidatus Nealsonbacteria bacterium]